MRVTSDKLTKLRAETALAWQQANWRLSRIVEIHENEYRDMFDFESFCGNDFAEEKPIHPRAWAGINW